MEELLDKADQWARAGGEQPERPDFNVPEEYLAIPTTEQYLTLHHSSENENSKGNSWFAQRDLPAGTLLMVAKPVGMVMDWQDDSVEEILPENEQDDEDDEEGMMDDDDKEPRLNELLLLQLLDTIQKEPSIWTECLCTLFPRTQQELSRLPAWVCEDDDIFCQIEASIQAIGALPQMGDLAKEISKRLPLIIRYNILSIETCPELLSYPGPEGHVSLSGVGLYHLPSFFNHSSTPNASRWAIGDVMGVVANQSIKAGTEICISYIEHDVLCESAFRRNQMLRMDFVDGPVSEPASPFEEEGPDVPVVDSDVQNELMEMDPFERLSAIEELLQQATGAKRPEGEQDSAMGTTANGTSWFQCDVQNLRILKAISLEGLGQTKEALTLWEESVDFCEKTLPPNDENTIVVRVQAAFSALAVGNLDKAREQALAALQTHALLFGGGVARFRRRMAADLRLKLRPETGTRTELNGAPAVDILWPL
jgi:hypothetical protein